MSPRQKGELMMVAGCISDIAEKCGEHYPHKQLRVLENRILTILRLPINELKKYTKS